MGRTPIICTVIATVSLVCGLWFRQQFPGTPLEPVETGQTMVPDERRRPRDGYVLPPADTTYVDRVTPRRPPREIELTCTPVTVAPDIDGQSADPAWTKAEPVQTLDYPSQRPISVRAVRAAADIYFLVSYPDTIPSTTHRSFCWDETELVYKPVNDREDAFVFKWSRDGNDIDMALREPRAHRADVWLWKARRTNPSGFADDKWQSVSSEAHAHARPLPRHDGASLYLRREGDQGLSAYTERLVYEYEGQYASRHIPREPTGSRADVRAKGHWENGGWTIEFARRLDTGHADDVRFVVGETYLFGVSLYEMAGGEPNPQLAQALWKAGDVYDRLLLRIQ